MRHQHMSPYAIGFSTTDAIETLVKIQYKAISHTLGARDSIICQTAGRKSLKNLQYGTKRKTGKYF